MGKTNPTFRQIVDSEKENFDQFWRMLRRRNQPLFDEMWDYARRHADAGGAANRPDPMEAILLSMLLGQQREIEQLRERLEELEK